MSQPLVPRTSMTCAPTEFQCLERSYCIHNSWLCDGDDDCPDGSDEDREQCGTAVECRSDQFRCVTDRQTDMNNRKDTCFPRRCRSGTCIPGHLQCSGTEECNDGSDEENCSE